MKFMFMLLVGFFSLSLFGDEEIADYEVHEWGTFTSLQGSDGKLLNGLHRDEEKLPSFVYGHARPNIMSKNNNSPFNKGFHHRLENVTIKMETPVLYFYSKKEMKNVYAYVGFRGGAISEWYPHRVGGETIGTLQTFIDFSRPTYGSINWRFDILAPDSKELINTDKKLETHTWTAPRNTGANKIKVSYDGFKREGKKYVDVKKSEVEKFLFYRGIGNFKLPLNVKSSAPNKVELSNNGENEIPYVMIYEKIKGQKPSIWWSGKLNQGQSIEITKPKEDINFDIYDHTTNLWRWKEKDKETSEAISFKDWAKFMDALTKAGLYQREAISMLSTWKHSYFEQPGLKVFWIVPDKMTNHTLPLMLHPKPKKIKRVLVGRSEVLTPDHEAKLVAQYKKDGLKSLSKDRFYYAYLDRVKAILKKKEELSQLK